MASEQPNFRISGVVDPTAGAMQAIAQARAGLSDIIKTYAADEELQQRKEIADRNYALAQAQEGRAATDWTQKQDDRTANREFLDALSKSPEARYEDITGEVTSIPERMAKVDALEIPKSIMDKVKLGGWDETTKTMVPNDYSALTTEEKAQMDAIEAQQAELGQDLVEKATIRATKVDQIEDAIRNSKNVTPEMYAALSAAKKEEQTLSTTKSTKIAEERKALEKYIRDLKKANADDSVAKQGHYSGGSSSTAAKGKKTATGWGKETSIEDVIKDMSLFGWFGESDKARDLAQIAIDKGLSPDEYKNILTAGTTETGKDSSIFRDNKFINPNTEEADSGAYVEKQIEELSKKKAASSGTSTGGFYNKEDASAAISYRNREIADAQRRIAALAAIDPTPKTREERDQLAREGIVSVLNRGFGDTSKQSDSEVKKATKKAVTTPKEETKKIKTIETVETVETPLAPPVRPNPRDFDMTTKTGQEEYVNAVKEYGKVNKDYSKKVQETTQRTLEQEKSVKEEKESLESPLKGRLKSLVEKDPTSSMARYLTRFIDGENYRGNVTTDRTALQINKELEKAGVIQRVQNEDKVGTVTNNIAAIEDLMSKEKDESTKRAYQTAVYHQMYSLPKDNPLRVQFDEALNNQDMDGVRRSIIAAAELATLGRVGVAAGEAKLAYREGADIARKTMLNKKNFKDEILQRGVRDRGLVRPSFERIADDLF